MGKPITIDEDLLWNTLNTHGLARYIEMLREFLMNDCEYKSMFEAGQTEANLWTAKTALQCVDIPEAHWRSFTKVKQPFPYEPSKLLLTLQAINEDLGAGQRYDAQAKVERLIESLTKQGER